jgi:antirestriction protein
MEHEGQPDRSHDEQLPLWAAEQRPDRQPRVWIGSLADLERGILHGEWIDAAREVVDIHADIQSLLDASPTANGRGEPVEDWAIFDADGFDGHPLAPRERIETISRLARGIAEHGPAFVAWSHIVGIDNEAALAGFEQAYLGRFNSVEDYARTIMQELGYLDEITGLSPRVRRYLDIRWDRLAHDIWTSGDVEIVHAGGGGVWVFDTRPTDPHDPQQPTK